jgi:hypothetical protein
MPLLEVFVSHASGESELAKLLQEEIESDFIGLVRVFVSSDGTSIVVGDQWIESVVSRLGSADIYIVLCSQNSVDRPWINIELGAALSRGKRVIPIFHTDLVAGQFQRRPLSDYEGFNASDPQGLRSLYSIFQRGLESRLPVVDFDALASKVKAFESRYLEEKKTIAASAKTTSSSEVLSLQLRKPRVLCVSSEQFRELVRDDLELIQRAFPDQAHHEVITASEALQPALEKEKFDIIHVASYVCPVTGDLVFSPVDPVTKKDLAPQRDRMTAHKFGDLVRGCGAVLVVLANNETLALVTKLLPVTSVIFALEPVELKTLVQWIKAFYVLLGAGLSFSDACKRAFDLHQIPMMLYPQLAPDALAREFRGVAPVGAQA